MDKRVIEEKIAALHRCINRIVEKRPETFEKLSDDLDLQDILSVNLERAIQLCVDIGTHIIATTELEAPSTMAETFTRLENNNIISSEVAKDLRKAVGFRNIAPQLSKNKLGNCF